MRHHLKSAALHLRKQQGATLILVVLVTLMVITALLVAVSHLSLSGLNSTADQRSVLPSQFAAESGIARGQALLNVGTDLLRVYQYDPPEMKYGDLKKALLDLCQGTAQFPQPDINAGWQKRTVLGQAVVQGLKVCDVAELRPEQTTLFTSLIPYQDQALLTYQKAGLQKDERADFFSRLFSGTQPQATEELSYQAGFIPVALFQSNEHSYDLYVRLSPLLASTSQAAQAKRQLVMNDSGELRRLHLSFEVSAEQTRKDPNFTRFGYFVHQESRPPQVYNNLTSLSGFAHTNGYWTFEGNGKGNSVKVDGVLSGAGCLIYAPAGTEEGTQGCLNFGAAGFYDPQGRFYAQSDLKYEQQSRSKFWRTDAKPTTYRRYGQRKVYLNTTPSSTKPNFAAPFVALPANDALQRNMALERGIFLPYGAAQIHLTAEHGYQYIFISPCVGLKKTLFDKEEACQKGSNDDLVVLRYAEDYLMQIQHQGKWLYAKRDPSALGGWAAMPTRQAKRVAFNGVLYSAKNIGSLHGPSRSAGALRAHGVGAAIASHALLTVAAHGNITLTGDLLYQERCLDPRHEDCYKKSEGEYVRKNMFGIYSYAGDVLLGNNIQSLAQSFDPERPNAPSYLEIDGFVMATQGTFAPTRLHEADINKGRVYVRGGVIRHHNAPTRLGQGGWRETVMYDRRGQEQSPPAFPSYQQTQFDGPAHAPKSQYALIRNVNLTALPVQQGTQLRDKAVLRPTGNLGPQ